MQNDKFKAVLGNSPEVKILELLIEGREFDYTFNDIIRGSKINRNRAYPLLGSHLKQGLIIESRKVKNLTFYKLNIHKKEIKLLLEIYDSLVAS